MIDERTWRLTRSVRRMAVLWVHAAEDHERLIAAIVLGKEVTRHELDRSLRRRNRRATAHQRLLDLLNREMSERLAAAVHSF